VPPSTQAWQRTWFDQEQEPTGGGYLAFAYGKPQAAKFSLIPIWNYLEGSRSDFISLAGTGQPERGGREKWAKRSLTRFPMVLEDRIK